MKPPLRRRRRAGCISPHLTPRTAVSVTPGDDGWGSGVHVITSRRGSYTLDVSRVPRESRSWYLKEAPRHPWPAGCLVLVSRHGQWRACWDLRDGLQFGSYFPAETCGMFLAAVP